MLLRLLPLLLILFSTNIRAVEFPIEIIEYIDDTRVVAFINEDDIDKKLPWTPFKAAVPLSITGALIAIEKQMGGMPELKNTTLTGIELKQIPHHKKYWHYLVKLSSKANDKLITHYFVVLMNGKVIAAIKEPETYK